MTELDWKKEAIKRQTFYCDHLADYGQDTLESYTYEKNSIVHLKNKLGFILFGSPNFSDNSENASDSTESIGCCVISSDVEVSKDVDPIEEEAKSFVEHKDGDEMFKFLVKLLDTPSIDLNDTSPPLIEQDSHYYGQFVNLIFGHNCQDDLNINFDEDFDEDLSSQKGEEKEGYILSSQKGEEKDGYILYYSDPKQIEQIDEILEKIESCSGHNRDNGMFVSFIFVVAKIDDNIGEFPVIRVLKSENVQSTNISFFIDLTGRCYDSWDNFLDENIFPSCIYCYPKNGFYTCDEYGNVLVEFGQSPESKVLRKVSQYGDVASNIAGLGCAGVALASLICPVAAPILIGTSGVGLVSGLWSSGRSIYQLVDRKLHKQDLSGREAAGTWLTAATGIFSIASMGALNYTQYLAKNGRVLGRAANLVVNGIEVTNTGLNGVNIGHQAYNMYEDRAFNIQNSVSLALSVLFFYNSAMKFKTAKQILLESQKDVISNIENQLSCRQRKGFKKIVRGTTKKNLIEGNARVIKTINNLEDPTSYFKEIPKVIKTANKTKSNVAFSEDASGKIKINEKIEVQPDVINSMSSKSKQKIFNSSRKWHQNEKYHKLF